MWWTQILVCCGRTTPIIFFIISLYISCHWAYHGSGHTLVLSTPWHWAYPGSGHTLVLSLSWYWAYPGTEHTPWVPHLIWTLEERTKDGYPRWGFGTTMASDFSENNKQLTVKEKPFAKVELLTLSGSLKTFQKSLNSMNIPKHVPKNNWAPSGALLSWHIFCCLWTDSPLESKIWGFIWGFSQGSNPNHSDGSSHFVGQHLWSLKWNRLLWLFRAWNRTRLIHTIVHKQGSLTI